MKNTSASHSDKKIRKAILRVFSQKFGKEVNLRVGVLNGIVHIAGVVDTTETRSLAETFVTQIDGVLGIVNRIEAPDSPHPARIIHLDLKSKVEV